MLNSASHAQPIPTKPYEIEFEIRDLPKTYNQMGRQHWAVKAKEAKKWIKLVWVHVYLKTPPIPLERAKVTFTRLSSRSMDSDNLAQSFKHVLDGLVRAKVLQNDTYQNIGMPDYRWEKVPPKQGSIKVKVQETLADTSISPTKNAQPTGN